jgi:hypothetical protein
VEERSPTASRSRLPRGELVVKWDLDNKKAMRGRESARVIELMEQLEAEGWL